MQLRDGAITARQMMATTQYRDHIMTKFHEHSPTFKSQLDIYLDCSTRTTPRD